MNHAFYSNTIKNYIDSSIEEIVGRMSIASEFPDELTQKIAWIEKIQILKDILDKFKTMVLFTLSIQFHEWVKELMQSF